MTEPLSWFSIPKIISAIWANGSRFLFSVAVAGIAAAAVLWLGARYGAPKAQAWWYEYGLMLVLVSAVAGVFAIFKFLAERQNTKLFLIADEAQKPLEPREAAGWFDPDAIFVSVSRNQPRQTRTVPVEGPCTAALVRSQANTVGNDGD
ncbi:MAG: hypothetical protein WA820_26100 [Bradyrhizobium sp.]|jgi:hypothetical protein